MESHADTGALCGRQRSAKSEFVRFVRNVPTSRADVNGHCGDDACLAQHADNDVSLLPHDLGTAVAGYAKQLGNIATDTLHAVSGGAIGGSYPINGHDEKVGANAANVTVAVVPALGEEGTAGATVNRIAGETEAAGAAASISKTGVSEVGGASKVDNIISSIDKGGFNVTQNAKSATQEGNVTITHPSEPGVKLNLRSETHPIPGSGGKPVPHVNVERVEPGPKNRPEKGPNQHITD